MDVSPFLPRWTYRPYAQGAFRYLIAAVSLRTNPVNRRTVCPETAVPIQNLRSAIRPCDCPLKPSLPEHCLHSYRSARMRRWPLPRRRPFVRLLPYGRNSQADFRPGSRRPPACGRQRSSPLLRFACFFLQRERDGLSAGGVDEQAVRVFARSATSHQCDSNVGPGGRESILFVAPPRINSRIRECPYAPITRRLAFR